MQTKLITPQLVVTVVCVALLVTAASAVFHLDQPEASAWKCALFAIKAITTSGVPDNPSELVQRFLVFFLPTAVFAWACLVDALVNRR
jgi:hypothetical protein